MHGAEKNKENIILAKGLESPGRLNCTLETTLVWGNLYKCSQFENMRKGETRKEDSGDCFDHIRPTRGNLNNTYVISILFKIMETGHARPGHNTSSNIWSTFPVILDKRDEIYSENFFFKRH